MKKELERVGPVLQQGERFYEISDLWIKNFSTWKLHCSHWNRACSSWQLQEYLSARYRKPESVFSLCSAERNHFVSLVQIDASACWGPAQNTAFGLHPSSTHRKLQNSQEQPEPCYVFTPGLSRHLAQACLTLHCHTDATLPCQGGEAHENPSKRTPPLAPGPCLQTWCLYR